MKKIEIERVRVALVIPVELKAQLDELGYRTRMTQTNTLLNFILQNAVDEAIDEGIIDSVKS